MRAFDTSPGSSALQAAAAAAGFGSFMREARSFGGGGQEAAAPGERCREMRIPREKGSVQHLAAFNARPPTKLLV